MAEGFFAGFASRMGQNVRSQMERQHAEEQANRKVQLEMLMDMASRPDLRDEFKQPLLTQLLGLVGAKPGKGKKGQPGFEEGIANILKIFDSPSQQPQAAQQAGENEELAQLMGVGQGGNIRPREVSPYMEAPQGSMPAMPSRGAFYTSDELLQKKSGALEQELKLRQKYDRRNLEDANWIDSGETIVGADGIRKKTLINRLTGDRRVIDLPIGETVEEVRERMKAAARERANPSADKAFAKIDAEAAKLAAVALGPEAAKDPKAREQFFTAAAQNLVGKDELSADAVRAGIEYRLAGAAATRVNTPQPGQPTAAAQRSFAQVTKQISELEAKIKQYSDPDNLLSLIGQKLKDGTVIQQPGRDDPAGVQRLLQQRQQLIRELSEEVEILKRQRIGAAFTGGVPQREVQGPPTPADYKRPPQKQTSKMVEKPKTGTMTRDRYTTPKMPGDVFFDKAGRKLRVRSVLPDGRLEVEEIR